MVAYHKSNFVSYIKPIHFAQIKSVVFSIEFLSFLLRKPQLNFYKEFQVSDRHHDFWFLSDVSPKKIAPAEHPAGL